MAARLCDGLGLTAVGGMLAYGGFLAIVAAIVLGIAALGLSYWLAALNAGVALGGLGYLLIISGTANVRAANLTPERTVNTLKEDAEWIRSQAR